MKNLIQSKLLLVALVAGLVACGGKETAEPEVDRIARLLSTGGAWTLQAATVDGTDQLSLYEGLTIAFTDQTYSTTNGGVQWPVSGTWLFTDATARVMERNDGLLITLVSVSEEEAVISFVWDDDTFEEGRSASLGGNHRFTFTR